MTDVAWCQPDYEGKIHPRKFMVVYEDSEMGNAVFDNEDEAREPFEKASISWNCYLFGLMPRATIPVPRGGIETDWHTACVLLRRRFRKLEKAASAVVKATDEIHDNDPWPIKYRAPYGAIAKLRETIAEVGTAYLKDDTGNGDAPCGQPVDKPR